jgi:large subunit ribosomal protein L23
MDVFRIIKEPVISEKTTDLNTKLNQVVFRVDLKAGKQQIKEAVEKIYVKNGVRVSDVRTMIVPGKRKRVRMSQGMTPKWKKAIVTLKPGSKLDFQ